MYIMDAFELAYKNGYESGVSNSDVCFVEGCGCVSTLRYSD